MRSHLYMPDPKKSYTIQCNTNSYKVVTCLSQRDQKENLLQPISFVSQEFTMTQQNWSTIKHEAYAMVRSIKILEVYMLGAVIELIIDHNILAYLLKFALIQQNYKDRHYLYKDITTISHCPGAQLNNADSLSVLGLPINGITLFPPLPFDTCYATLHILEVTKLLN